MKNSNSRWEYPFGAVAIALFLLLAFQIYLGVAQTNNSGAQSGHDKDVKSHAVSIDHKLGQLAKELPGFGGMYFDDEGNLSIILTPSATAEHRRTPAMWNDKAKAALTKVFGKDLLIRGVSVDRDTAGKTVTVRRIIVREGKYEVGDLMQWRSGVENALSIKGVVLTDLDEVRNRLRVGIEKEAVRDNVILELLFQGVPLEAVIIEVIDPVIPGGSLKDYVRVLL